MNTKFEEAINKVERKVLEYPKIELNEIVKYSDWPRKLLGIEDFNIKYKTKKEVLREYDVDKWGVLLNDFNNSKWKNLDEFILHFTGDEQNVFFWKNNLYLMSPFLMNRIQIELIKNIIKIFLPTNTIIEIGSGFGNIILNLANDKDFKGISFIGGELTNTGIQLTNLLAKKFKLDVTAKHCDISQPNFFDDELPSNAIIFTNYSLDYLSRMNDTLIKSFRKLKPKVIISCEPIYKKENHKSLLELMMMKYIHLNDYNTNYLEILQKAQRERKINIDYYFPQLHGSNPFLPVSLLVWSFK